MCVWCPLTGPFDRSTLDTGHRRRLSGLGKGRPRPTMAQVNADHRAASARDRRHRARPEEIGRDELAAAIGLVEGANHLARVEVEVEDDCGPAIAVTLVNESPVNTPSDSAELVLYEAWVEVDGGPLRPFVLDALPDFVPLRPQRPRLWHQWRRRHRGYEAAHCRRHPY